jgi:hypothetical protein
LLSDPQANRDRCDLQTRKASSKAGLFVPVGFGGDGPDLTFHLEWSPDHLKVINKIEEAVSRGGLFSLAMARGFGRSSLAEVACIWAVLNGYRDFACLIGSDEGHACDMLDSIKTELDSNDLLAADYPEICFPIQALDGIANRANGQLFNSNRMQIGWIAREIVLPTIAGSKTSGAIIKVAGLTGRIRGMKFKRPDRKTVWPSLVVLDDLQPTPINNEPTSRYAMPDTHSHLPQKDPNSKAASMPAWKY